MKREELRIARLTKNLTQSEVGKYIGVSGSEFSKIENGLRNCKLEQAKLLIKLLNINLNML